LTAQALTENLDNALRQRGGATEVRRRSRGHPNHFGVAVDFSVDGSRGRYSFQIGAAGGGDYRVIREEYESGYGTRSLGRPDHKLGISIRTRSSYEMAWS
jgi:hypothetical protein